MQRALQATARGLFAAALLSFGFALWHRNSHTRALFLGLALLDCCFIVSLWRAFLLRLPLRRRYRVPLTYDAHRASYVRIHVAFMTLASCILLALVAGMLWGSR